MRRSPTTPDATASTLRLGAAVSVLQSALFVIIGAAALVLGVDRLVSRGIAALPAANITAFRALCLGFVLIATLGLAITPAERAAVEARNPAWAAYGATLAYVGHAGTIAYFTWWLVLTRDGASPPGSGTLVPLEWGVLFELVLVGAWVWIITGLIAGDDRWPRGFVALSIAKAASFWFAYGALLAGATWAIVLGVGAVTFVTGPVWHLWIPRMLRQQAEGVSS